MFTLKLESLSRILILGTIRVIRIHKTFRPWSGSPKLMYPDQIHIVINIILITVLYNQYICHVIWSINYLYMSLITCLHEISGGFSHFLYYFTLFYIVCRGNFCFSQSAKRGCKNYRLTTLVFIIGVAHIYARE